MSVSLEKGAKRIIMALSGLWIIVAAIFCVIDVFSTRSIYIYSKAGISFIPDSASFGWWIWEFLKHGLTSSILIIIAPIAIIWLLFALFKCLIVPLVRWIIAGFQNK
jgi:DMSO reductase anchor subunit